MKNLIEYILSFDTVYFTQDLDLYQFILANSPQIAKNIEVSDHDTLSSVLSQCISSKREPIVYKNIYANIVQEVYNIDAEYTIVTDNINIRKTLESIYTLRYSISNLIFDSARALCMQNNHIFIETCALHSTSGAGEEQIYRLLKKVNIKTNNGKLGILKFIRAHQLIIELLTNIKKFSLNIDTNREVSPYEYIEIIREKCYITKYKIMDLKYVPWTNLSKAWIAGLNSESRIDLRLFSDIPQVTVSFHQTFQKSVYMQHKIFGQHVEKIKIPECMPVKIIHPCPKLEKRSKPLSVSHITKIINNPYSFYIESILNVKYNRTKQSNTIGNIIHCILENSIKSNTKNLQSFSKKIIKISSEKPMSKVQKMILSQKINAMVPYIWEIFKNAKNIYPEIESFQEISHKNQNYTIYARADLLYETKNNKIGVIDFKTGSIPSFAKLLAEAPQIPIEILFLKMGSFLDSKDMAIADSGFISPKGFFKIQSVDIAIKSAIKTIEYVIDNFLAKETPYIFNITHTVPIFPMISREWIDG